VCSSMRLRFAGFHIPGLRLDVCQLVRRHLCPSQKHLLWHVNHRTSGLGHLAATSDSQPHPPRPFLGTLRAEGIPKPHPHPCPSMTWSPRPGRARRRARRPPPPARAPARSRTAGAPPASARAARATRRRTAARPRARPPPAARAPARRKSPMQGSASRAPCRCLFSYILCLVQHVLKPGRPQPKHPPEHALARRTRLMWAPARSARAARTMLPPRPLPACGHATAPPPACPE